MLRNISIASRIFLLVLVMTLFSAFLTVAFLSVVDLARRTAATEMETAILNDHKELIKAASHSLAQALAKAVEPLPDERAKTDALRTMIKSIRYGRDQSGYFFVQDEATTVVHPITPEREGRSLGADRDVNGVQSGVELRKAAERGGDYVSFVFNKPGRGDQPKIGYAEMIPGTPYSIGTGVYVDNVEAEKERIQARIDAETRDLTLAALGGGGAGLLCVALPLCLFISRSVTVPLRQTKAAAEQLAGGDHAVRLTVTGRDETSAFQRAFNAMADRISEGLEAVRAKERQALDLAEQSRRLAERAECSRGEAENACGRMLDAAGRLEHAIVVIAGASDQVGTESARLLDGAETQKRRVAETAVAVEQMNGAVLDVARNAGRTAEDAKRSSDRARQGARMVEDSVSAMRGLQERTTALRVDMARLDDQATAIGRIMEVISDIADQTNLLALNAAIEAARAGDAGRGFAVVADEVRKLAEKTMIATEDVGQSVTAIQSEARRNARTVDEAIQAIDGAADLAERSGSALADILRQAEQSAERAGSIAAATEEQSAASEQIARSMEEINDVARQTAAGAEGAVKAVRALTDQAAFLRRLMEELKTSAETEDAPELARAA